MKTCFVSVNLKDVALFASVSVAAFAPMAVCASAYNPGTTSEIVLMAGSDDGTTNTLAEAISEYNTANGTSYDVSSFNGDLAAYAIVKEGDGTLVMDTPIQNFTGPIVINDGVVACMCQYALGADNTSSHIYVRDGATIWINRITAADGKTDTVINENRNYHVKGTGHNDQGAMNTIALKPNNSYTYDKLYGKTLSLD
ncbi:MAG: hypothetical protein IJI73_01140, partial [Kiritimatiellae bacterium]|nr:hypothetical protein [Kiritimatiellia bacterium]